MPNTNTTRKSVAAARSPKKRLSSTDAAAREERYREAVKRMEQATQSVFEAVQSSEKLTAKDYAIRINAKA